MHKTGIIALIVAVGLATCLPAASAQGDLASGLYQITSGHCIACCGFGGPLAQVLPNSYQTYINLTVDPVTHSARMTFLGSDQQTPLAVVPMGPQPSFTFAFTDGVILADHIQFEQIPPPSEPSQPSFRYSVTNSTGTLWINGAVVLPCPGCADVPTEFTHTNVVAILTPVPSIRVSEVELCWNGATSQVYKVQYTSSVTTNAWTDLGSPISASGSMICVSDKVLPGQAQRYYRVVVAP